MESGTKAEWRKDLPGLLGALLLNLPNYVYPYFEDSALFAAIGSWMHQGLIPYRDIVEQKPPAIYWLTYLTHGIFGSSVVGSRTVELVAILLLALGCARIVSLFAPAGRSMALLLSAAFCSGSFWRLPERGQVEFYEACAMTWAVFWALRGLGGRPTGMLLSGAATCLAAWFKPQAILLCFPIGLAILAMRSEAGGWAGVRRAFRDFAAGGLLAAAPFLGWLAWTGSLGPFVDVIRNIQSSYLQLAPPATISTGLARVKPYLMPGTTGLLVVAFGCWGLQALARGVSSGAGRLRAVVLLGGWLIVGFVQFLSGRYLFNYHKVILVPSVAVLVALGIWRLVVVLDRVRWPLSATAAWLLSRSFVFVLFLFIATTPKLLFEAAAFADWLDPSRRQEIWCAFGEEQPYYDFCEQATAAERVRAATAPTDRIQAVNIAGALYLLSERLPATRYPIATIALDKRYRDHEARFEEFLRGAGEPSTGYFVVRSNDYFPWFNVPPGYVYVESNKRLKDLLITRFQGDGEIGRGLYGFLRNRAISAAEELPKESSERR